MIPDSLLELAYEFKKVKLWTRLYDTQLFAVAHSDGTIGYCCVMGKMGEHFALAVYPGPEGMDSYRRMAQDRMDMNELEMHETAFSQNCVMLSFENKDELRPGELARVRAYCAARGLSPRGRSAFPQFRRFKPYRHPWYLKDGKDQLYMQEALEAGLAVAAKLSGTSPEALGFTEGPPYLRSIPLLRKEKGEFVWDAVPLPVPLSVAYPSPRFRDEIALARLTRSQKRGGEWACSVFMHMIPIAGEAIIHSEDEERMDAPFYPYVLLMVDNKKGIVLSVQLAEDPDDYAETFAKTILNVAQNGGKPSRILVRGDRARALFGKLAGQLGAELVVKARIPRLEEAEQEFLEHFGDDADSVEDELDLLVDRLRDPKVLADMPDPLVMQLRQAARMGVIKPDIARMIMEESDRRGFK